MPSHQERIQQNYCKHEWPYLMPEFRFDDTIKDGRRCLKCNLSFDTFVERFQRQKNDFSKTYS